MIILDNVSKNYNDKSVVDRLSIRIGQGEFFGLIGPNGAGKTTTIRMLTSLTSITSGSISIDGQQVSRKNTGFMSLIGLVPQSNNLEPELTVRENLKHHGLLYKMKTQDIKDKSRELIEFADLDDKAASFVSTLSGGMKRKLLIIRALMHNPDIILLDEPTVGLDVFARRKVWDLIKNLHAAGKTIILTTHYLDEAEALCDKIALINKGKLVMSEPIETLRKMVGPMVVEHFEADHTQLYFFPNQRKAFKYAAQFDKDVTVRQTKLEDIFVKLTQEERE